MKITRAVLIGGISSFVFCPTCFSDPEEENARVLLYYSLTFFLIYELVDMGVKYFNKKYDWITQPRKMILANVLLIVLAFLPLNYLGVELTFGPYPESYTPTQIYFLKLNNLFTALLVLLYINSKYFFSSWEKSVVQTQEMSKQQVKQELLALKNQINPHFLFNNLNTLTQLVSENNPAAEAYIFQLSNIYRYLLDEKKADIVAIEKEFKMFHSITYLLKIKYGENLQFVYNEADFNNFKIATFTLQLLIENAVKHNVITADAPLFIHLYLEDSYLVIKNNVLKKPNYVYSSGIGLDNIISRYKLLSKRNVLVEESEAFFIVKIPILSYEGVLG
ncbi:MAG TPA: histidine kinase [Flavobacteriaceae bacterium]|nr:histidine kinase [Flavobacteriaceae bacterium]MCB9212829.1 histidine kinase [Alteromonas sp.]HPF12280.1 histidine kinase [Flavobacteriaceae bacterium]HQU21272.1 histidine kinase [Flavobacteriaceae bacterium]HQU66057.1 histidine kinase [Flavobacteriaceae bacterium]